MTTFHNHHVTCGNCGTKVEVTMLMSTNSFGSPDLDSRPPQMKRSTMDLWVQECPKCGYVSADLSDQPKVSKEFLESDEYKKCQGISFKSDLAARFYRNAMLELQDNDILSAYNNVLYAAWASDDKGDKKAALRCRVYLDELYAKMPAKKKKDLNMQAKHIDVLRRAKMFEKAIELCEQIVTDDEKLQAIIEFQKEKSMKKDVKCYKVFDVLMPF